jgi:hypothetical protein
MAGSNRHLAVGTEDVFNTELAFGPFQSVDETHVDKRHITIVNETGRNTIGHHHMRKFRTLDILHETRVHLKETGTKVSLTDTLLQTGNTSE